MIYSNTDELFIYIKKIMLEKKIKSKDLAQNMNRSQSALNALFKRDNITLESLNDVCKGLDCELEINFIDKNRL